MIIENRPKISAQIFIVLVHLFVITGLSDAQAQGRIFGKVTDKETGQPVRYGNVVIVGTKRGGGARLDGSYSIDGVPAGIYSVKAMRIGYDTVIRDSVIVKDNQNTRIDFELTYTWQEIGDETKRKSSLCYVHNIEMDTVIVPIVYSIDIKLRKELLIEYDNIRYKRFPFSEPYLYIRAKHYFPISKEAKVFRCPKCIEARKNWIEEAQKSGN